MAHEKTGICQSLVLLCAKKYTRTVLAFLTGSVHAADVTVDRAG